MNESTQLLEFGATAFFFIAIVHTFLTSFFQKLAHKYPSGSVQENFFHLIGEVEVVFGLWAGVFILFMIIIVGKEEMLHLTNQFNFREPIFVVSIMIIASTKPIIVTAQKLITNLARVIPIPSSTSMYFFCLVVGPLLGSLITEPAAMTVTALILYRQFYTQRVSEKFKYITIAVLFVNVSIGGVLTHYAAPPVLMVADAWNWDTPFMFHTFGWKAVFAVLINTVLATFTLSRELRVLSYESQKPKSDNIPLWLVGLHLLFLALVVITSHHAVLCVGALLFFLGIASVTPEYQDELKIRQSLLVGFFLAGLVVLGNFQSWWLTPLLHRFNDFSLFVGTTFLTSITDNAALTYLGSQVENVSDSFKYALMAGAVAGGGLTVIANAPNPAGFSILQKKFGQDGISPIKLFVYALIPTFVAMACFWIL